MTTDDWKKTPAVCVPAGFINLKLPQDRKIWWTAFYEEETKLETYFSACATNIMRIHKHNENT